MSLDQQIDAAFAPIADAFSSLIFYAVPIAGVQTPLILLWLLFGAIYFTFYMRFINFRGFRHAFRLVRGKYDDPRAPGTITHFQALTTALSGTVGLGNIAGVAIAISLGGPGAAFWMILAGFFGMSSKFVECSLGVKYRKKVGPNTWSGGPMHYLQDGLSEKGYPRLGKFFAYFACTAYMLAAIGGAGILQVNQAYVQFVNVTGGEASWWADKGWLFGLITATIVAAVIMGGIRSIVKVTSRIVPFMCGIYILAALTILITHYSAIPSAIALIVKSAFAPTAIAGGMIGAMIQGLRRSAFSNEAGLGSAAIAHSVAKTRHPVSEGFVALLEPFFDTVIVCTATALVVVITGAYQVPGLEGVEITSQAFGTVLPWFPAILSIAVILFAFSTMISWEYYGDKSLRFIFGESKVSYYAFKIVFCVMLVVGATASLDNALAVADSTFFAAAIPNLIGLYILAPGIRKDTEAYLEKIKSGKIKAKG